METFKDVISGDQLVLVDFFATWCQPCKMMHPILKQVKEVLGDRIRIIKVDVDKYGVAASQYGIQSVPTLMLFRHGEVLWRTSGVMQQGVTHFWRTAGIKHFHLIDTLILQRNIWIYKRI